MYFANTVHSQVAVVSTFANINSHSLGLIVYLCHQSQLTIAFWDIGLIDTYCIDP